MKIAPLLFHAFHDGEVLVVATVAAQQKSDSCRARIPGGVSPFKHGHSLSMLNFSKTMHYAASFKHATKGLLMVNIDLAAAIKQLRAELNEAIQDATNERLRFELGPIEFTVTVVIAKEANPTARVRIYVIEAGAGGKFSSSSTQQLKLTLTPVDTNAPEDADGKPSPPFIRGRALPGER